MFIIVESGSTKADWVAVGSDGDCRFFITDGINPSTQKNFLELQDDQLIDMIKEVSVVYFYGAGADDPASPERTQKWLSSYGFVGNVEVKSDMLAAARASSGLSPAIVCILGTGSNSCVYDGTDIIEAIPSLGYVLSDEGGGVHIGKEVIRDYFYNNMPHDIKLQFQHTYQLTKSKLIKEVYGNSNANRYIASFASFLSQVDGTWKDTLIKKVFREFVILRLMKYKNHLHLPLKFVGSIAFYYQSYLKEVLKENDLHIDTVLKQPIHRLIDYHINIYKN